MTSWTLLVLCSVITSPAVQGYWTTSGGPSCRYNCGRDLGSCSCSSSCRYNGSCCYDFYSQCSSTTQPPRPTTTAALSCHYNCGRDLGGCSCSSSCQYYGNCCYDFYYYCPTTTVGPHTTAPVCGGSLHGSGSFSSPYYPNNYHNYAYCVWYLSTSYGERIYLSFNDLQFEYCCSCDYIQVYDGPSVNSSYLGKVCSDNSTINSTEQVFSSSSNYMTVVFRSDSSVVDRGFNADFTSSLPPTSAPVCGGSLHGSGSFSSPYYPNNYHNYAYCVWYLSTSYGERIYLSFNDLQFENCCSCDYIQVYDGPSVNSSYLGKVCSDTNSTEQVFSSSNYMTVVFRSDSSVVDRGFNADFTSSLPPTSAPVCGGSLHGYGSFSSPYYPNNYHNYAYCVWYLSTSYGERIYLSFNDLQFEYCCSCDYIQVYDGPSVNSSYLGKVCSGNSNTNSTEQVFSSSNYMTVVFRSDSSVVSRGFNADFTSSLPPTSGRVDCSSDEMTIVLKRSYLNSMGYDGHDLYLNDQYCRPQVSRYEVVFRFPINTCGTERKFENGRIVYSNGVRASASASNYSEITRLSQFKLNVGCRMEQDTMVQIMYVAQQNANSTITGTGRFNGTMAFYTSSNFYYQVTEVPYRVVLNQYMYVQVSLGSYDSSLVLFLDTCVASPSPYDFHTRYHDLVRNGCARDNTYYSYVSGSRSYARFRFQAFQFLRANESVYLQCKVLVCSANDYNSRCRRGCYKRKARDSRSAHDSHTLVLGPIKLKDPETQDEGVPKEVPKEEVKA